MRELFSLDGAFNKYGGMLADMVILSLMWLFFSAVGLGLTIGASTSAMFYVSTRRIANREGYITSDFWFAFKANFKRATFMWLMILVAVWLIWFNLNNIDAVGAMAVVIFPAQIVLLAEVALMSIYIFPMNARFDMGIRQLIKSSFFMANRHLLTSITCLSLLVAGVLLFFVMPPIALFLAPGVYAWLSSYMIMKVFRKYRPEMDKDPMLEIQEIEAQKELERRRKRFSPAARGENNEITNEEDAFWAIQEEDEAVAAEEIPENEDDSDIWTKLREAEVEDEPAAAVVSDDAKDEAQGNSDILSQEQPEDEEAAMTDDYIFGNENDDTQAKGDIWSQLRESKCTDE